MNSFERFHAVLNGKKPDKLPFYFTAVACSVASQILNREVHTGADSLHFKEELSWLDGDNAHEEFVQKYREDILELYRKLNVDISRDTWRCKGKPTKKLDDYTLLFGKEDGPHVIKRYSPEYQSYGTMEDTTGPRDLEELKEMLLNYINTEHKQTDAELYDIYKDQLILKEMAYPYFPSVAGALSIGFPMHNTLWLEATVLEPELLSEYFLHWAELMLPHIKWLFEKGFRFINGGADIASARGPIMSPSAFGKIFTPALKKLADECRKYGMAYRYATDGNIWSISDYIFRDAGVQAYGEVDRAASMKVGTVREKYPDLIIMGNISSATLYNGSEAEVREETRATLFESGGLNYVAGPSNAIVHGTPVKNIFAMIEEIEKFRP